MSITIEQDPANLPATALVFDLRNSTRLYRILTTRQERQIIVQGMQDIHMEVLTYLYQDSGLSSEDFAFNDTGDGYLILFFGEQHSFHCIICASVLKRFLVKHLKRLNQQLGIDGDDLKYDFGMGVHRSFARVMWLKIRDKMGISLRRRIIIGNASNSAARVESATKSFSDAKLLITGSAREGAEEECDRCFKKLFSRNGPLLERRGVRFRVGDGRKTGYNLYSVRDEFHKEYRAIVRQNSGRLRKVGL